MKHLLLGAVLSLLATVALAGEKTVNIFVSGLYCPSCGYIVGSAMKSVESVKILEFNEADDKKSAVYVVLFDDEQTSAELIIDAVFNIGYIAELVKSPES